MLSAAAKSGGVWVFGGTRPLIIARRLRRTLGLLTQLDILTSIRIGSIPERDQDDKIYNSSPVFSPDGSLVALHRKTHLFDISVPGGVTFRESETLTGGSELTIVETGTFPSFSLVLLAGMLTRLLTQTSARSA